MTDIKQDIYIEFERILNLIQFVAIDAISIWDNRRNI